MARARARSKGAEPAEALASLGTLLHPGDTVWTVLRHVSRSGMSRVISPVVIHERHGGELSLWDVSWYVAGLTGHRFSDEPYGVKVDGAGMDMGFHLVYGLARVLFRDVDVLSSELPASIGHHPNDPGYWLHHRWL